MLVQKVLNVVEESRLLSAGEYLFVVHLLGSAGSLAVALALLCNDQIARIFAGEQDQGSLGFYV
jgi:hypothetical protein